MMYCGFDSILNKHPKRSSTQHGSAVGTQKSEIGNRLHSENLQKLLQGKFTHITLLFLNRESHVH